jgi:succinyl-CoA synthetase beta subunit
MDFEEHAAKLLILAPAGIAVPRAILCTSSAEAAKAAQEIGPCVVKAQVPTGKRGKAGGIKLAGTPAEAGKVAAQILGMRIGGHAVERVLVEEQARIAREFYAAVLNDTAARKPLILFSTEGGMEIEEVAAEKPDAIRRLPVDIDRAPQPDDIAAMLGNLELGAAASQIADVLLRMHAAYRARDAELLEINPLALLLTAAWSRSTASSCSTMRRPTASRTSPRTARSAR